MALKYYFKAQRQQGDLVQTIGPFSSYGLAMEVRERIRGQGSTVSPIASSEV